MRVTAWISAKITGCSTITVVITEIGGRSLPSRLRLDFVGGSSAVFPGAPLILKVLTFGAIALLLLLRLARTRFGSRLLGVPLRVLEIVFLAVLVLAGILAVVFELWILLVVVVVLLVISGVEELRRHSAARASSPRTSHAKTK